VSATIGRSTRRSFLVNSARSAVGLGMSRTLSALAQTSSQPAQIAVDTRRVVATLDRRLFGSFLEHLGRAIYGGVFEPGSPLADQSGFRRDVLNEIKTLAVPLVRYPGGNFVSGYDWLDGVGPRASRPAVLDRAWNSIETNQFGTNEFLAWCRASGAEPLLGLNFGTGTAEKAAALVEYCNVASGTRWSDLRRRHGVEQPWGVTRFCLGNEMDGPWQIGHMTAEEYGRKAVDAARQMRAVDPRLQLVACGSGGPTMATYLEWDRVVLEECYDQVDAISLHRYFGLSSDAVKDDGWFLASNLEMERQIEDVSAVCDYVRGRKRSAKRLWLSFDEWNVWYRQTGGNGRRQQAPHLLEEVYDLRDALVVGGALNSLMRHADRVRLACLAQLVNVIAPIVTDSTRVVRQTIYYPYAWALAYAKGQVLDLSSEVGTYDVPTVGKVPFVDVTGTMDPSTGDIALFVLNRDVGNARELRVTWRDAAPVRVVGAEVLTGRDLKASNTFDAPSTVVPQRLDTPRAGANMTFEIPARSYAVIRLAQR
jgi:alpha-N-arabinofuranosidase